MTLVHFKQAPWKRSHAAFDDSCFNIRPAPEFSTGEVLLASLYRNSGFATVSEKSVPTAGRQLDKAASSPRSRAAATSGIEADTWRTILDRVIQSPKASQQSKKRFLSLSPVVPDVSLYSGSARLAGNPWNPGQLVQRMVQLGSLNEAAAEKTWKSLHTALGVSDNDDIWARWLQSEFESRRVEPRSWELSRLAPFNGMPESDRKEFLYPAQQFVIDLNGIIDAKSGMTRRQWTSLLEAVLRLGTVSHVLWLCDVNDKLWRSLVSILSQSGGAAPSSRADMVGNILAVRRRMLSYGNPANPTMRDFASKYLSARLGINCVLWGLEELGSRVSSLQSTDDLLGLVGLVRDKAPELRELGVLETYYALQDQEIRTINCKKGVGANLIEFCQYTLGQRQTLDQSMRGYDQGYYLRKRGEASNSPWVLAPGPAAVLAMAHCCLHEVKGPRSVKRLAVHLGAYGIEFDTHGLNESDLGKQLRMLGLVLDSPDAESGMLLVPPFAT